MLARLHVRAVDGRELIDERAVEIEEDSAKTIHNLIVPKTPTGTHGIICGFYKVPARWALITPWPNRPQLPLLALPLAFLATALQWN